MCDWSVAANEADLLVLNRGMHYMNDSVVDAQLSDTFDGLIQRRSTATTRVHHGGGRHRAHSIVYRGIHAPIPSCHILDDPLPRPFPYAAADHTVAAYHWAEFASQNALVARLAAARNITFLDVHTQTAQRPGGHMPARKSAAGDCAHYCLPGPIDEWVRLLLALWA